MYEIKVYYNNVIDKKKLLKIVIVKAKEHFDNANLSCV